MPVQPPPSVPSDVPQPVADYLRQLNLWAYQELNKAIRKDEATSQLILAAYDQKQNPNVFRITISNSGALTATQVPLGGGRP
jgi:hypothetical protein